VYLVCYRAWIVQSQMQLGRALLCWMRCNLIALEEVGYVPLAEVGARFLFQLIAE
jgi:hypothetical protein